MSLENIIGWSLFAIFVCILPIGAIIFIGVSTDKPISKPQEDELITYTQQQMDTLNACYTLLDKIERNKQRADRVIKACDDWLRPG